LPVDKSGSNLVLFTFRNQKRRACWNELSLQQTIGKSNDKASTHNACVKWRKCISIDFVNWWAGECMRDRFHFRLVIQAVMQ
jgi:hypothetical protein